MKVKKIEIPEGAEFATLYEKGLHLPLKEAADRLTAHNLELIERTRKRDFNPATELDASGNKGESNIHFLGEQVVLYPEGWVPFECAEECRKTSELLVERLMGLDDAPIEELDEFRYRLRNFFGSWMLNYKLPRMEERDYRKRTFRLLDDVGLSLIKLHKAYLLRELKRDIKRRTKSERKWTRVQIGIFDRIDGLRKRKFSVPKAIEYLRQSEYSPYFKGIRDSAWKSYYYSYKRGE